MIDRPQAIPLDPPPAPRPPARAPATAEHTADHSTGYRLTIACMIGIGMAQWLDAQTWLPFAASHEMVHFWTNGVITLCGLALGFLPALRRRVSR